MQLVLQPIGWFPDFGDGGNEDQCQNHHPGFCRWVVQKERAVGMSTLFRGPTKGYKMTQTDVEWLARSMWGEASTRDGKVAVAWCHMMRFLLVKYVWLQTGWSFTRYMQAHSQPINPEWREDGAFCRPGGKYHGTPDCSEHRLRLRDTFQLTPYDQVPEGDRKLAEAFAEGNVPNPFEVPVYDFAADSRVKKQFSTGKRPGVGLLVGGNRFLRYEDLNDQERKGVLEGTVDVGLAAYAPTPVVMSLGAVVLISVIAGAIVYALGSRGTI